MIMLRAKKGHNIDNKGKCMNWGSLKCADKRFYNSILNKVLEIFLHNNSYATNILKTLRY